MDKYLTSRAGMLEIPGTITSKGQVTIPARVRKHLGLKTRDKIAFIIQNKGEVCLKAPRYANIAALRGAAGTLKKSLSWEEVRAIAREDRLKAKQENSDE